MHALGSGGAEAEVIGSNRVVGAVLPGLTTAAAKASSHRLGRDHLQDADASMRIPEGRSHASSHAALSCHCLAREEHL